ncbi:MAG TPA: hypothetical protein VHO24_14355 [Opitutaceae bacterium]|nr:hypothetical protein [Opitutaceae bacterium]
MKANFLLLFPALPAIAVLALAQAEPEPQLPPPVVQAPAEPRVAPRPDNQKLYGPSGDTLIGRETANGILEGFRKVYTATSTPRIVVYVNRELVDLDSGLKHTGHSEKYEKTQSSAKNDMEPAPAAGTPQTQINVAVGGNNSGATTPAGKGTAESSVTKTSGENTYQWKDPAKPTLADRQTVREIERLFGRAFRNAGAKLADQKSAAALLDAKPDGRLVGDAAANDRAALAAIADIAVEVLVSSRNLTVPEVGGDKTYSVPDIQATAIRLKDSAIVGQASASDVLGKDIQAGRVLRQFDVRDITEATALALMEDMLTGAK